MARFSRLAKGTLEGEVIDFEIRPGLIDRIRVLPLLGSSDAEIAEKARHFAEKRGAKPEKKAPEYEIGVYVHTLLLACKDPDSPTEKPDPYFASAEEILDEKHGLDRSRIALLYEHQMRIQEAYAPKIAHGLGAVEFFDLLQKTTEADEGAELPFERLPRATQRTFVRGIALLATTSLLPKSGDGQSSQEKESSSEKSATPGTGALEGEP
jgi:hypothetical protein